jgi:hypothetical protein
LTPWLVYWAQMKKLKHRLKYLLAVACLAGLLGQASAADISSSVTQSFNAGDKVQTGMAIRLQDGSKDTVVPLEKNRIKDFIGVVVPPNSAPVVLSPSTVTQPQVLAARRGINQMLVSNQNGIIKSGDLLTISGVAGIGMKNSGSDAIIGKATEPFNGQSGVIGTVKLSDNKGQSQTVALGRISVDLNDPSQPIYTQKTPYVPDFLAKAANSLANKQVSVGRIYIALGILILTAFITGNMLAGGVRGGMIAIGRNPLTKKTIARSMLQASTIGMTIFVIGLFAVYLLLKL